MELDTDFCKVFCCEIPEVKKAVIPVECSMILPDYFPDVMKILRYTAKTVKSPVLNENGTETVSGNCDWGTDKPDYDIIKFGGKTIFFTHGARFGVKGDLNIAKLFARKNEADILLFGHTHVAVTDYDDGLYIMNPGSCGRPREGLPSYGIIDITEAGIAMHTVEL